MTRKKTLAGSGSALKCFLKCIWKGSVNLRIQDNGICFIVMLCELSWRYKKAEPANIVERQHTLESCMLRGSLLFGNCVRVGPELT